MKLEAPEMRRARIEIVPMIDTIFFLLVFFMITWLAMVKMNGLTLNVPRQIKSTAAAPYVVDLSVSGDGKFYVNTHSSTTWPAALKTQILNHPGCIVVINVAPTQKTQTLISVVDSVNGIITDSHARASVLIATPKATQPK